MRKLDEVLRGSHLFDALGALEFDEVVAQVEVIDTSGGEVIITEGEEADALYIVLEGAVQVFSRNRQLDEIVLARLEGGRFFGEQALLPNSSGRRNASVRSVGRSRIARIGRDAFQQALAKDSPLRDRLEAHGAQSAHENLLRQSLLFRSLHLDSASWAREQSFADGDIVFSQGSAATDFYVVIEGAAGVYRDLDGNLELLVKLRDGQGFGELALIHDQPRTATVIAEGKLKVLVVDGRNFMALYASTPDLQAYMQTLQKVYMLPGRGFMTQHAGEFMGRDAITTMYHLSDGRKMLASRVIGEDLFNMSLADTPADAMTAAVWRWEDGANDALRELGVSGNRIISATVRGTFEELGDIHRMILDGTAVHDWQRAVFESAGTLRLEEEPAFFAAAEIICACADVSRGALADALRDGCRTPADLAQRTGASSVCGACAPRLAELCGRSDWTPLVCTSVTSLAPDVRAFTLAPLSNELTPFAAGQHVVLQAQIEGTWIQRPYTLSSPGGNTGHYEITVKREPLGLFSNWMFDHMAENELLQVSSPQGHFHLEAENRRPVLCFVAGIGVTPALSMARSLAFDQLDRGLHVDYCAPGKDDLVYLSELLGLAEAQPNISVSHRSTRDVGHISEADVAALLKQQPDAVCYICGPEAFQNAIATHLRRLDVPANRVHVEVFTAQGGRVERPVKHEMPDGNAYLWSAAKLGAAPDQGPDPDAAAELPGRITVHDSVAVQASAYLRQFYSEKGVPEAFEERWREVSAAIERSGTYEHTYDELAYGAKLAWRNASRCVGRLFWQGLQVRDAHRVTTTAGMFFEICEHIRLATNDGNLRAVMTTFAPQAPDADEGMRVWNPQLLRYAGYRRNDGSILGDPANAGITDQAIRLGWTPPAQRSGFDLLPVVLSVPGAAPTVHELPPEIVLEVPLVHPDFAWFGELGLRWYALPAVSEVKMSLGGLNYTAAPFNGWYMGTEIGGRNFSDPHRYDMLPEIARRMGLSTRHNRSMWKDRALVELNVAVLYSYEQRGVKLIDHHAATQDFMEFVGQEVGAGRKIAGRWSWLVPPISGSATPTFHHEWEEHTILPQYFYQQHAWEHPARRG